MSTIATIATEQIPLFLVIDSPICLYVSPIFRRAFPEQNENGHPSHRVRIQPQRFHNMPWFINNDG